MRQVTQRPRDGRVAVSEVPPPVLRPGWVLVANRCSLISAGTERSKIQLGDKNLLFSEAEAGSGVIENTHSPNPDAIAVFADTILYVNLEECTSCTACYQPDVCPVGAIYSEDHLPDGGPSSAKYNAKDENKGHDHTFFIALSHDVFAD